MLSRQQAIALRGLFEALDELGPLRTATVQRLLRWYGVDQSTLDSVCEKLKLRTNAFAAGSPRPWATTRRRTSFSY